jgi:hypothetical protein
MKNKLYIYIHIPKTAGMFIKNLLKIHNETSKIHDPFTDVNDFSIPVKNAPTIQFVKMALPATNSDQVGFFVIVRNPYDRIYSMWKWSRQNGTIGNFDFPAVPNTFEEFVIQLGQGDYNNFYFMQSQLNYIKGEDINNIELFKFEDIESIKSFLRSCNVGWSEDKINNVPGPNYKDVYTSEMVEIIKTYCKDEFETFGYSTEL